MSVKPDIPAPTPDLADLIVHLARLGQSTAATRLTAAQWMALRYFARASRLSRTPSAFSCYHATTRGTASQTVKSLVEMGLLARQSHATDGRSTILDVTEAGHAMLRRDPLEDLRHVLARLDPAAHATIASALGHAASDLAHLRDVPVFGTCVDCAHCQHDAEGHICRQSHAMLGKSDMAAICVEFRPVAAPADP